MDRRQFLAGLGALGIYGYAGAQDQPTRGPDVIFVPTPDEVVDAMLKMAAVTKNDVVYDLGCGDGRIVITAAQKYGARGVGIDIDPERIKEANANAKRPASPTRVKFIRGDLFEADISEATVVTLYLLPTLNMKLRPKLLKRAEARHARRLARVRHGRLEARASGRASGARRSTCGVSRLARADMRAAGLPRPLTPP